MPWPTLKMCPGRVPVRFSSSAIFIFSSGNGANRATGSRLPCHRRAIADVRPGLVDIDAPIHSHHVAAGRVQLAEEAGSARAEVNHRHAGGADALDEGARIGLHEAHVIVRPQRAHPTVEDLYAARAD
jgi:hypothetical protein